MQRAIYSSLLLVLLCGECALFAAEAPDYSKQVQPILTKYCTACHNDEDREGKLSLDSYGALLKGGDKGASVTPGHSDLSRLVRVLTGQSQPAMPPKDNEAPSADEVAVLKSWIDAGAKGPSGDSPDPTLLVTPNVPVKGQPKSAIHAIALSPAGDVLALAKHGQVELRKYPGQAPLFTLAGHSGSVNDVVFSADGKLLASAAGEPGLFGEAKLWNVAEGSLLKTVRGHKDSLYAVALSPDGQLMATGGYDSAIRLWNAATGAEVRTFEGHNGAVFDLAFSPNGKFLASASGDRTVKLWAVQTGERLDTLKESVKELYAVAFNPGGDRLAAAGVDNRIRLWQVTPDGKEGTNTLLVSKFAHELPILRLVYSADGQSLVSTGEDRLIKVWSTADMSNRQTLEKQSDWASGVALLPKADKLVAGRIDGTTGDYEITAAAAISEQPLTPLSEVPPAVTYGPQPAIDELPKVEEAEPNDAPSQANLIGTPGTALGRVFGGDRGADVDEDLFRFDAIEGQQWIIETEAARKGSPVDSKIEVLDLDGKPVPRLLLRAVRDTEIEFRGMSSDQRGVRLKNWDELLLNEYVYLNGEVLKHFQQRRGPDADGNMYPENGNRFTYFETTPRTHALGELGYLVIPYPIGTKLPNNGLPVFTLNYENDDQSQRQLGKDSRVTFVAPRTGSYLVRVSDVRGFTGDNYTYRLIIRRPQPDFKVTLGDINPTVNAGSGKKFSVKAERFDNFNGPIRVDVTGAPPGFQISSPIVIPEGMYEAQGVVNALKDAPATTEANMAQTKASATADIAGSDVTLEVPSLGTIKLADKPKVLVHLSPAPTMVATTAQAVEPAAGPASALTFPTPPEITIHPGEMVSCHLRVERNGFNDRIQLDVHNLPHGVIVDDIGLNGILIPEGQTERTIFLRAEPWVPEQSREFFAVAQVEGNQASLPMKIHVKH
jgi:hypothetical protein